MSEAIELEYLSGKTRIEVRHYQSQLPDYEWRTRIELTPAGSGTSFVYGVEEMAALVNQLEIAVFEARHLSDSERNQG